MYFLQNNMLLTRPRPGNVFNALKQQLMLLQKCANTKYVTSDFDTIIAVLLNFLYRLVYFNVYIAPPPPNINNKPKILYNTCTHGLYKYLHNIGCSSGRRGEKHVIASNAFESRYVSERYASTSFRFTPEVLVLSNHLRA